MVQKNHTNKVEFATWLHEQTRRFLLYTTTLVIWMPIYEYQAAGPDCCDHCLAGFDVMQKLADAPPSFCPECHNPVRRKISRPNLSSPAPSLSQGNIEKHGLTQFKKVEKGVYEKTAGKGPDFINTNIPS